ncbi:MAG: hypothetical protein CVV27_15910 [Candidatus Melainabacteria bacterium HGW-Melainabacteria-1]|nr:MAG: hypothetical protein CVV27_15910 [Candidatus Melainabacteria bacterium HGW-Melainabacteria-1]
MTHPDRIRRALLIVPLSFALSSVLCLSWLFEPVFADEEASNWPYVQSAEYGRCYLRAVPAENYGTAGKTEVFAVHATGDQRIASFAWYSPQTWIHCNVSNGTTATGLSLVRLGPWARGRSANAQDLALAFSFADKEVRRYSTLDLAGTPANVSASVSHYTVISKVLGYRWINSNTYVFEVLLHDGRKLVFDPTTGAQTQDAN